MDAHEITTRLPPLREDEPVSLRQEIVDEILDHLMCGLRRELLIQGGDESSAKERVLSNFGDPREIARKLWFQAMRSKIMSQRIVVGSALFSMTVCVALVGMMAWMMQQQQQANAALIEHLAKLVPPRVEPLPRRDFLRNQLQAKITLDSQDGPPAKGFVMTVKKLPELGDQPISRSPVELSIQVDQSGLADCGYAEPGRFEITVTSPWNEQTQATFTIHPDRDHLEHIVVPGRLAEMTKILFRVDELPLELASNSVGLVMRLRPHGSRVFADRSWKPKGRWQKVSMPIMLLSKDRGLLISSEPERSPKSFNDDWILSLVDEVKHGDWAPSHEWSLPAGQYAAQFGLANLGDTSENSPWPATDKFDNPVRDLWLLQKAIVFTAEPGKLNEWTIRLPEYVKMCLSEPSKILEVLDPVYAPPGVMGGFGGGGAGGGFF